jgi:hypothetical protein
MSSIDRRLPASEYDIERVIEQRALDHANSEVNRHAALQWL